MAYCLVTKLKSVVNNGDLLKLGEVEFDVVDSTKSAHMVSEYADYHRHFFASKNYIGFQGGAEAVYPRCEIIGNGQFLKGGTLETASSIGKVIQDGYVPGDGKIFLSDGNYKLRVSNKYTIMSLLISDWLSKTEDISLFKYFSGLINVYFVENYYWNGDLAETAETLTSGAFVDNIRCRNVELDFVKASQMSHLWPFLQTTIDQLSSLEEFNLSLYTQTSRQLNVHKGRIFGSVEEFRNTCQAIVPNCSCDLRINTSGATSEVTYQGAQIPYVDYRIQWDSNGDITITSLDE